MAPDRGGEQAGDDENHERQQHDHDAQLEHVSEAVRIVGCHELRQERTRKVENADRERRHGKARRSC